MQREDLIKIIATGLQDCISAKGEKLSHYFNANEIYDFANTVVAYLPANLETRFLSVDEKVYNCLADKDTIVEEHLKYFNKLTYLALTFPKVDKTDKFNAILKHLIFNSLLILRNMYDEEADSILEEIINFYESLSLTADQLKVNIESISANAVTESKPNGIYCVRMDNNNHFVPTIKTIQNFNNLIPVENYDDNNQSTTS